MGADGVMGTFPQSRAGSGSDIFQRRERGRSGAFLQEAASVLAQKIILTGLRSVLYNR